MYKTMQD